MLLAQGYFRRAVAEAIGTFVIVFAGCGAIMVGSRFPGMLPAPVIPLIFGLAVAVMIYAIGHISGAHFNPAVTLAFAAANRFPKREIGLYWAAQFVGSGLAVLMLHLTLPGGSSYGATTPSVAPIQALVWESLLTFFLMFVISALATDSRAVRAMSGAAIGATVALGAAMGSPVTGASMNPARSLAPAIAQGQYEGLWIYFVGPAFGAVLAALTYQWLQRGGQTE